MSIFLRAPSPEVYRQRLEKRRTEDAATIDRLAGTFTSSGFDIRTTLRDLLSGPEFLSAAAYHGQIKQPVDLVIGSLKALNAQNPGPDVVQTLRRMGQDLLNPPDVSGWKGGSAWINSSTLFERFNFVNKLATAVQLRFDVARSPSLPAAVRERLRGLAGRRLTGDGVLVITAQRHRTQGRNREDALARLIELIRRAATAPRRRRPTKPPAASRRARLESKKRRSDIKHLRAARPAAED